MKEKPKQTPEKPTQNKSLSVVELTEDPFFKSIAELQVSVEDEIRMIKSDELRQDQARNINTARRNQYRGIELSIQYKRLGLIAGGIRAKAKMLPLPVAAGE